MINIRMRIIIYLIIFAALVVSISAMAQQKVVEVPQIENLTEARAIQELDRVGLIAKFQKCFSNTTKKYYTVPGSQDPEAGFEFVAGSEVRAAVSLGRFPTLIGLSENEAKDILEEANISYEIQDDRNNSVKDGYVFDQEPRDATCLRKDFKAKIFVNKPLTIEILSPKENDKVGGAVLVTGRMSSDLMENEYLWIAVKPLNDVKNWWPQNNKPKLVPISKEFEGNAFLGGNKNQSYEIGILVVDEEINKNFMNWLNTSLEENNWPSITQGRTGTDQKVAKEVIESHKVAKVNVILYQ